MKLQVADDDVERAAQVLEGDGAADEHDDPAAAYEASPPEQPDEIDALADEAISPTDEAISPTDETVSRALRAAMLGLLLLPLQLYSLWLLAKLACGDARLSREQTRRMWIALAIDAPSIVLFVALVWALMAAQY